MLNCLSFEPKPSFLVEACFYFNLSQKNKVQIMSLCVTVDNRVQGRGFFLHYLYSHSAGGKDLFSDAHIRVIGSMEPEICTKMLTNLIEMHFWQKAPGVDGLMKCLLLFVVVLCVLLVALTIISRVRHGDHNYHIFLQFGSEIWL